MARAPRYGPAVSPPGPTSPENTFSRFRVGASGVEFGDSFPVESLRGDYGVKDWFVSRALRSLSELNF